MNYLATVYRSLAGLQAILAYGWAFALSAVHEPNFPETDCVCKCGTHSRTLQIANEIRSEQCKVIQSAGIQHVLYAYDKQYRDRIASYWSVSAQLSPDCIIQPVSTTEVSQTMRILAGNAACVKTNFAVRGGGHMPWAGSNNIDHGITIDLGLIHTTTFNADTEIASVGSGSRWAEVYAALEPYGVTVAGGRTGTVGVAGFLMGGGNSFYTAEKGFACDTVVNFEVVLATG